MKLKQLDYHRNGISGMGFHVAIVQDKGTEMLVIRMGDKEADRDSGSVLCAAFDLALLDKREIRFFYNSFRGDYFADKMDEWIEEHRENSGVSQPHPTPAD